jgi:hypothetical protein
MGEMGEMGKMGEMGERGKMGIESKIPVMTGLGRYS